MKNITLLFIAFTVISVSGSHCIRIGDGPLRCTNGDGEPVYIWDVKD